MKTIQKLSIVFGILIVCLNFTACNKVNNENVIAQKKNIIVVVKYKAQPAKESETVSALTDLITDVKKEPHFVNIKLHVDPKDKTNILLYEEWSDESYFISEHMATEHLQKFIKNSRNFLAGSPEISFWQIEKEFK